MTAIALANNYLRFIRATCISRFPLANRISHFPLTNRISRFPLANRISRFPLAALFVISPFLLSGCRQAQDLRFQGQTMGTSYLVKIRQAPGSIEPEQLKAEIDALLHTTDHRFSNWQKDELHSINEAPIGEWKDISHDFCLVMIKAGLVWKVSERRFDPAIGELVDLWGFGPSESPERKDPSDAAIQQALSRAGMENLELRIPEMGNAPWGRYRTQIEALKNLSPAGPGAEKSNSSLDARCSLRKRTNLTLNPSAIAKGHGVDRVGELLESRGITDYMVEIGGEVKVGPTGSYRIGIERPNYDGTRTLYTVLEAKDTCIATSGNYRNFFEVEGQIYSHILVPRTGRPGNSRIQSATVVGPDCALTDALATAAMLAQPEETDLMIIQLEMLTEQDYDYMVLESGELVGGDTNNFTLKEYSSSGLRKRKAKE